MIADKFRDLKIVVIGDCMLNHNVYGNVNRISPEGPFPVLSVTHETDDLGGAGGVYANLSSLGVQAKIVGIIGDDAQGRTMRELCENDRFLVQVADRPTIQKTRFIGNGAQIMRADHEKILPLSEKEEVIFISVIKEAIADAAAIILSDYAKGALTKTVIAETVALGHEMGIPVFVDPKGSDFSIYKGADIVTPNRKELSEATSGGATSTDAEIEDTARRLLETSGVKAIVATRSEQGMTVLENIDGAAVHLKADAREVADVSGAGDTVIATLAAGMTAGMTLVDAAMLANKAAGIVVGRKGVCVISAEDLFGGKDASGYLECTEAKKLVDSWKAKGLKVGFTNGCFDILHAGHVTYLAEAANHCDRLVLGLNHDNSVRILKGPTRPVNDERSRAIVMSGLSSVDAVILFGSDKAGEDNTPGKIISYLQPDIIFKGGDYTEDQLPEAKIVRAYGGDVKIMSVVEGKSTTNIIKKISEG